MPSSYIENRRFWERPLTQSFIQWSLVFFLGSHFLLWALVACWNHEGIFSILRHYDAFWYNRIIHEGYGSNEKLWGFFPLYPTCVGVLYRCLGGWVTAEVIGSCLSTGCFLIAVFLMSPVLKGRSFPLLDKVTPNTPLEATRSLLIPVSRLAWITFLFSPASYVFHSHLTESLFLLVSVLAFHLSLSRHWVLASIMAGLGALTRIPGAFLAMSIGLLSASQVYGHRSKLTLLKIFTLSGIISGFLWCTYFLYMDLKTGDPFVLFKVQAQWTGNGSLTLMRVFRTLWFGNPSQHLGLNSMMHHPFTLLIVLGSLGAWKKSPAIGIYGVLCMGMMFFPGELISAYRYSAVLFPILFFIGDYVHRKMLDAAWPLVILWVGFNGLITVKYALGTWAG